MSKVNFESPKLSIFDDNGDPLSGGKVYFYESGTSTFKNTYADADGLTTNSNPVILDSRGEADVFLDRDPYKIVVKDSSDVTVYTRDNYHGYLQEDDGFGANLLINSEARVNENGYVSGSALSVGDDLFDKWECSASGTVTFTAGGSITLGAGTRIRQTNDDITAWNGKEVTCFLRDSGSVTVNGLGLSSATIISLGNPVTFTIDTSSSAYLELGSGSAETYAGLQLVLGSAATNCPRRPVLVEQFITKDYMADIATNAADIATNLQGHGVVSRANFEYSSGDIVVTGGHYRMTSSSYDKIVNISASGITISASGILGSRAYLYILSSGITATDDVINASQLSLSVTAPTLNHSRNGWYNGDDRCIGTFLGVPSIGVGIAKFFYSNGQFNYDPSGTDTAYLYFTATPTFSTDGNNPIQIATGISSVLIFGDIITSGLGNNATLYFDTDSAYSSVVGAKGDKVSTIGIDGTYNSINSASIELVMDGRPSNILYFLSTADFSAQANVYIRGYRLHDLI